MLDHTHRGRQRSALAVLLLLLVSTRTAQAAPEVHPDQRVAIAGDAELLPNGDVQAHYRYLFSPATYARIKKLFPDPRLLLRDLLQGRTDVVPGRLAEAAYDDAGRVLSVRQELLGFARHTGERWEVRMLRGTRWTGKAVEAERLTFTVQWTGPMGELHAEERTRIRLPAGAQDAGFDAAGPKLHYRLAWAAPEGAPGKLDVQFQARGRLMATTYKVYGQKDLGWWVAKTVLANRGRGPLRDLRLRYRVEGYGEWSAWEKFPLLVPGQTAVSTFYPVLDERVARLQSTTPARVTLEYRHEKAGGGTVEESESQTIAILGMNEFQFSHLTSGEIRQDSFHDHFTNAALLAAWVSRNDPVIKKFAAMAAKNAGGVGATQSLQTLGATMKAAYELLLRNEVTYQYPPAMEDRSIPSDPTRVQNVKFPRDVLRDRSGTCIDLAILYAAMLNAIGVESVLILMPGHCFPAAQVTLDGKTVLIAVEATGVGGGVARGRYMGFQQALAAGEKSRKECEQSGKYYVINVREQWARGVSNPELPAAPENFLEQLGISERGRVQPGQGGGSGGQGGGQSQGTDPHGSWSGRGYRGDSSYPVVGRIQRRPDGSYVAHFRCVGTLQTSQGPMRVQVDEWFAGRIENGALVLRGVRKVWTAANGQQGTTATDTVTLAGGEGGTLVGRVAGPDGSVTVLRLARTD